MTRNLWRNFQPYTLTVPLVPQNFLKEEKHKDEEMTKDPEVESSRSYSSSVTLYFRGTKAPKTHHLLCFGGIREGRMIRDRSLLTSWTHAQTCRHSSPMSLSRTQMSFHADFLPTGETNLWAPGARGLWDFGPVALLAGAFSTQAVRETIAQILIFFSPSLGLDLRSPPPSTESKTVKTRKVSKKSPERSLGPPDPGPRKVKKKVRKVKKIVDLQTFSWDFSGFQGFGLCRWRGGSQGWTSCQKKKDGRPGIENFGRECFWGALKPWKNKAENVVPKIKSRWEFRRQFS